MPCSFLKELHKALRFEGVTGDCISWSENRVLIVSGKHRVPPFGFKFKTFRRGILLLSFSVLFCSFNVVFRNLMEQFRSHSVKQIVKETGRFASLTHGAVAVVPDGELSLVSL